MRRGAVIVAVGEFTWSEPQLAGLAKLGWTADERLTSEDEALLQPIADEAAHLDRLGRLSDEERDRLSGLAFETLASVVAGTEERAAMVSGTYAYSRLSSLIPLVDEATLAFFRGYHTASFATLLVVLERYLRLLLEWKPPAPDPSFKQLTAAIERLPPTGAREVASRLVAQLYSRYDAITPTAFHFNRHGLLHGVRGPIPADEMNSARMFVLLDSLAFAEYPSRGSHDRATLIARLEIYSGCVNLGAEARLLGRR
jgi:hypothetical protein